MLNAEEKPRKLWPILCQPASSESILACVNIEHWFISIKLKDDFQSCFTCLEDKLSDGFRVVM